MAKKASSKKNSSTKSKIAWGAGIGALAAGAAGAYFLYGTKEGAKKRKQMKSWVVKMKGDVMKKLEGLKEVNEKAYNKAIDEVASKYKKVKSIDSEELGKIVNEMKKHWKNVRKEIEGETKKKTTKKKPTAKKTTRKKTTKKNS